MKRMKLQEGVGILITLILIAIVAAAGGFAVYRMKKNSAPVETTMTTPAASVTTPTPSVSGGTTDADLDKNSADVDTKLKALNADTSITDGLNDQQGNLSEQ